MQNLGRIYALWCLENHIGHLFQFGLFTEPNQVDLLHGTLLRLCKDLLPESVVLADVLAPPDFILNSFLGNADGNVYKHLQQNFYANTFARAHYWPQILHSKI